MNEPRVFKHSPFAFLLIILLFGGMLIFLFVGLGQDDITLLIPIVLLFGLVGFISLLRFFIKTTVSDEEISSQTILGTKTLRWSEISRVSGRGYAIKLHNFDEDITVAPSPQLPGYEEIVEWIGTKRPDLFSVQEFGEMKRGAGLFIGLILLGVVGIGILGGFLLMVINSQDATVFFAPLFVLGIMAFVFFWMILFMPQSLTLEGNTLTLKYLFKQTTLKADEISAVFFGYTRTRNGKQYYVSLQLANKRQVRVSGVGQSMPITYLVLKNWHKANSAQSSFSQAMR